MNKGRVKSDLSGQKFNRLLVLKRVDNGKRMSYYNCLCDCGNLHTANGAAIKNGHVKSCGCLQKEKASMIKRTHGFSKTRLYRVWRGMITRCENPNFDFYRIYGAKGVSVCDEWRNDFVAFREWALENGYDENAEFSKCTLDRIDTNGNYEPNNCRWVDMHEQGLNKSNTKMLTIDGITKPLLTWARENGIHVATLKSRIERGIDPKEALVMPLIDTRHTTSKYITFNGITLDQAGWSRKIGISKTSLGRRLKNPNWTLEMALTTPPVSRENAVKYRKDRRK